MGYNYYSVDREHNPGASDHGGGGPFFYALEMIENPGHFVCDPTSRGGATVLTFETQAAAEEYYWAQECLLVLGTKITRV